MNYTYICNLLFVVDVSLFGYRVQSLIYSSLVIINLTDANFFLFGTKIHVSVIGKLGVWSVNSSYMAYMEAS